MRRLLLAGLVACLAVGCQSSKPTDQRVTRNISVDGIDVTRLMGDLYDFADESAAEISGASGEIAAGTRDRRIRELALRWRIRAISAIEEPIFEERDPRRSFVEALTIIVRLRKYFSEDGRGRVVFGEGQPIAVESMRRLEESLVELGYRHADTERIDSVREAIEMIAEQQPVRERGGTTRLDLRTAPQAEESDAIGDVLGLPLAPLTGLQGVSSTAEAVHRIALVVAALTEVIERMPQRIRWQMELATFEIEDLSTVVTMRRELERVSANFEKITESVQTMPADIRAEFEIALTSTDDAQTTIRQTLQEVQQTSESLGETIDRVDRTIGSVNIATGHLRDTAQASESLLTMVRQMQAEASPDGEPLDIDQLATMTEQLSTTVVELRGLLEDLASPISDTSGMAQVLTSADESMSAAIDRLFWRGLWLVVVMFVLAGGYRLLFRRPARG